MEPTRHDQPDALFPPALAQLLGVSHQTGILTLGNPDILRNHKLGLFCSTKCPGDRILRAYDLAKKLRDDGTTVIGGFHSPVETECLRILLRGTQPVIVCPARSLANIRIPSSWKEPIAEGRLLLLSPFIETKKRVTAKLARKRNEFVAHIADTLCFVYTTQGGLLEALASNFRARGKPMMDLPQ
jgi:predicted Rossmann fold nucleotide-binding protein DprA/Smf involved in DNA uptake